MPAPGEHQTVQVRVRKYAQEIGWRFVHRAEAEARGGFEPQPVPYLDPLPESEQKNELERARLASP